MTLGSSMLEVARGGTDCHQESSPCYIDVRTIGIKLYRFFRFEISPKPSYALSKD
jgi:hypothetical protein